MNENAAKNCFPSVFDKVPNKPTLPQMLTGRLARVAATFTRQTDWKSRTQRGVNACNVKCTRSTLPARVHCKGAPPSSEKQQRQNLARDAAPIGSDDPRPPERDALPDVLEHLLRHLRDERPDERAPVGHHRAAGRVAGVAAVTSQGSVLQGFQMKNGTRRYVPDMSPSDFKVALPESVFRVSFVCAVSMALRASRVPRAADPHPSSSAGACSPSSARRS